MLARAKPLLLGCLALTCVSCPSDGPGSAGPLLSARFVKDWYSGSVLDHVDAVTGATMGGGAGVEIAGGVALRRLLISAGVGLFRADGTDALDERLELTLFHVLARADVFFPLGASATDEALPSRSVMLSMTFLPYSTLLDEDDNGFSDGMGFGVEAAYAARIQRFDSPVCWHAGVGWRSVSFGESDAGGIPVSDDKTLRATYISLGLAMQF